LVQTGLRGLPHACSALLAVLLLAVALLAPAAPAEAAVCGGSGSPSLSSKGAARATLCLVNRERARRGLASLRPNSRLRLAAHRHVRDMVRRAYFGHASPEGVFPSERARRAGYMRGFHSWRVAENLAWGEAGQATPQTIVRGWMESPTHRRILLGPFTEVGIGVFWGAPNGRRPAFTYSAKLGWRR